MNKGKTAERSGVLISVLGALLLAGPASFSGASLSLDPGDANLDDLLPQGATQTPFLTGQTVWDARHDPSGNRDMASALAVHPTGTLTYVTGTSDSGWNTGDYNTVAYEALTGTQVWEAVYDGPEGGTDTAGDIDVAPDGTLVFVTGSSAGVSGTDLATIAYHPITGQEVWSARYEATGTGTQGQAALTLSPDGSRVYVTGGTGSWSGVQYTTIAYDAETGDELWVSHQAGSPDAQVQDIVASPDGTKLFLTGWTQVGSVDNYDYLTISIDAENGDLEWSALYDGGPSGLSYDFPRTVGISDDGALVYVTGGAIGEGTNFDITTVAYDTVDGTVEWVQVYDGPASSNDNGQDLAVSGDRVYVTGTSRGSGTALDHVTLAYDAATGQQEWESRYDGSGQSNDLGQAVAVSPSGDFVFSTGYSIGSGFDYATLAYNAEDGVLLWSNEYNGDGSAHDYARDIIVDPLELRVYVTGQSRGTNGDEYATAAYWI